MLCPRCEGKSLVHLNLVEEGIQVDRCPDCRGAWFDRNELSRIFAAAVEDLSVPEDAAEESCQCPRCMEPLFSFSYPETSVTIEMCKRCHGLWLDEKEQNEIVAARRHLKREKDSQEESAPTGLKGALLRFFQVAQKTFTG